MMQVEGQHLSSPGKPVRSQPLPPTMAWSYVNEKTVELNWPAHRHSTPRPRESAADARRGVRGQVDRGQLAASGGSSAGGCAVNQPGQ